MHAPRPALLVALAVYALGAMVLPALRLLARAGTTGVVLGRAPSPIHRFVSTALGSYVVAIVAWAGLYARVGAAPLGVWTTPLASQLVAFALLAGGFALMVTAQRQMGVSWRVGMRIPTEQRWSRRDCTVAPGTRSTRRPSSRSWRYLA